MSTKPKAQWTASDWWAAFKASKKNVAIEDLSNFVRANAAYIAPRCIPDAVRAGPCSVYLHDAHGMRAKRVELFVGLDYLGLGLDEPYLRTPVTPQCAQQIADHFGCMLPTPAIVDALVERRTRLYARPQERRLWSVWLANAMTEQDIHAFIEASGEDETVHGYAGHRKDVVLTDALPKPPKRRDGSPDPVRTRKVAIYGWHGKAGPDPIQELYVKHSAGYLDYSHGEELVSLRCYTWGPDGKGPGTEANLLDVMNDAELGPLVCGKDYPLVFRAYPMLGGEKPLNFVR